VPSPAADRTSDAIVQLLEMADPTAAQLSAIRAVFDVFDWSTDHRQKWHGHLGPAEMIPNGI
jgi:hypothetical protein